MQCMNLLGFVKSIIYFHIILRIDWQSSFGGDSNIRLSPKLRYKRYCGKPKNKKNNNIIIKFINFK